MKRLSVILLLAIGLLASTKRNQPPFVNERSLMRGARCQVTNPKWSGEDVFGDVAKVTLSKTVDTEAWVITFSDYNDCRLSFWAELGDMNKPTIIKALSSY